MPEGATVVYTVVVACTMVIDVAVEEYWACDEDAVVMELGAVVVVCAAAVDVG